MKIAKIALLAAVFMLVFTLAACGESRETTAAKLVNAYFEVGEGENTVSVLRTEPYSGGFLALVRYTGSGDHLLLIRFGKDASGEFAITHAGEGGLASDAGYSVNVLADGEKAILFGSLDEAAGYKKVGFTFEDGSKRDAGISGAKGYILVAQGDGTVKDFQLTGKDNAVAGSYKDYVTAGNSITRTGFMEVKAK